MVQLDIFNICMIIKIEINHTFDGFDDIKNEANMQAPRPTRDIKL